MFNTVIQKTSAHPVIRNNGAITSECTWHMGKLHGRWTIRGTFCTYLRAQNDVYMNEPYSACQPWCFLLCTNVHLAISTIALKDLHMYCTVCMGSDIGEIAALGRLCWSVQCVTSILTCSASRHSMTAIGIGNLFFQLLSLFRKHAG